MTRSDHLAWCKQRATEYVKAGDLTNAVTSMISDLGKHDETSNRTYQAPFMVGIREARRGDSAAVQRWIDGFN